MFLASERDLPWGRLALVITGLFLALLIGMSVTHEAEPTVEFIEVLHPRGAVDSLSPVKWRSELPGDPYRFLVIVRDDEVGGAGELLRSPFLTANTWAISPAEREGWGRVQVRVFVVDPGNMTDDFRKEAPMRSPETIAWERE